MIAHGPRDKRKRLEVVNPGILGSDQAEHQIDRKPVHAFIIEGLFQSDEQSHDSVNPLKSGVWQGNTIADTR